MSATQRDRRRAWARGLRAERLAGWWLRLKGYRILAQGYRVRVGEIDLVARRGRLLAMVEVKRRADLLAAAEAIDRRKRRRTERAAAAFIQENPQLATLDLRFDALLLRPGRLPHHVTDAWRQGES
jgi:putative endonuclease